MPGYVAAMFIAIVYFPIDCVFGTVHAYNSISGIVKGRLIWVSYAENDPFVL